MSAELARAATRGALWLGLVNLLSKGSQVLVTLALGVFLTAGELGTVTITVALLNLGIVLQSAGVYDVIARNSEEPRRFAGTVATLSLGVSVVLTVVVMLLAPQIALILGAPGSADLLRVAILSLPFTALAGVQQGLMHRELDFRRRLVPDAGSALVGAAVTVGCAAAGAGEWSLVAGLLTTAVLAPLLGAVVGAAVPLRWSRSQAGTVVRWTLVVGPGAVLGLVLLNVDYVIIARALGEEATGLYSFAYRIAFVPYIMGAVVLGGVAFPVYARLMASGGTGAVAPALVRFVHVVAASTGGAYVALAVLADRLVVIDARWADAVPVLRVLSAYGFLLGLILAGYEALRATGRPGLYLSAQVLHVVILVGTAGVLVRYGIVAVAWAQVLSALVTAVVLTVLLGRLRLLRRGLVKALLGPAAAAAVVALAHQLADVAGALPPAGSLVGGLVVGVLVLGLYAGALLTIDRGLVRDLRTAIGRRTVPAATSGAKEHDEQQR